MPETPYCEIRYVFLITLIKNLNYILLSHNSHILISTNLVYRLIFITFIKNTKSEVLLLFLFKIIYGNSSDIINENQPPSYRIISVSRKKMNGQICLYLLKFIHT